MQLFMAVSRTPSAAGPKAGDIADLSPSTFSYPWHLPTSMVSLFLSPEINLSPLSLSPVILSTGVIVTGDKFIAGDNDTGQQLSPVTKTPAINLLSVTRTRTPWRWGAAKDRRKLKGINR